jgi:arachidonate 15-lipoxygenase
MNLFATGLFVLYKQIVSFSIYRSFKKHQVYPLLEPIEETIELIPFDEAEPKVNLKGLYTVKNYPKADHAKDRTKNVKTNKLMSGFVSKLKRPGLPSIPFDHEHLIRTIYPYFLRKAWAHSPQIPSEFKNPLNVVGELALSGPFADYIRKIDQNEISKINAIKKNHVTSEAFTISMDELSKYPVKEGLSPLGGVAIFSYDQAEKKMRVQSILYQKRLISPGDPEWEHTQRILLCGMSTHLTLIKHNLYTHLILATLFTAVSINRLKPSHPIRRLLHPCFQTVLIGNYEIEQMHIRGPKTFFTEMFSFEHETVNEFLNDSIRQFEIEQLDPIESLKKREMENEDFSDLFQENLGSLWSIVHEYVSNYIDRYYQENKDLTLDHELEAWYQELSERFPNGLKSYTKDLSKESIKKLSCLFIFNSTVAHDNLNNVVWNYITLNQYIPTMVPKSGKLQSVDTSFDFLLTILVTWKPFNMLFEDFSSIALDQEGVVIMKSFNERLKAHQRKLDQEPLQLARIYPRNLNYSVSQ